HGAALARLMGASGAIMAVFAVFIWYYPRQTVLLYGLLPVPVWALGVLYLVYDLRGAWSNAGNVAHVAHLGGAAFGLAYAWRRWNLGDLLETPGRLLQSQSRFRILRPDDDDDEPRPHRRGDDPRSGAAGGGSSLDDDLREAVDRILEKISRTGEASLTPEERETLTQASRRLKERLR
ncbi:MAG: rhomboid family intramembrane serine protease, partial [Planctomycetaceae bacterium]